MRANSYQQALATSSASAWLKAAWQKILQWESSSLKLPNPEVIHLEKSKEEIFVILLPDQEEFNILDRDKKSFAQLVGISPWTDRVEESLPASSTLQ